jgi:hypothetical protein
MLKQLKELNLRDGISPNELFILYCLYSNEPLPEWSTVNPELRRLKAQGLTTRENKLTEKAIDLIESVINEVPEKQELSSSKYEERITEYNELFPNIKFPSGKAARAPMSALKPRFDWFFKNHNYSWDIIMEVTRNYLEEKLHVNWDKATCAKYFVKKRGTDYIDESMLAELCNLHTSSDQAAIQLNIFKDKTF